MLESYEKISLNSDLLGLFLNPYKIRKGILCTFLTKYFTNILYALIKKNNLVSHYSIFSFPFLVFFSPLSVWAGSLTWVRCAALCLLSVVWFSSGFCAACDNCIAHGDYWHFVPKQTRGDVYLRWPTFWEYSGFALVCLFTDKKRSSSSFPLSFWVSPCF